MSAEPLPADDPFDPDEPGIFDEEDAEHIERQLQEAEAQANAGRGIPHSEVSKWLSAWGTPDEYPMPAEWLK
jgi:predicted transcriptional regulator